MPPFSPHTPSSQPTPPCSQWLFTKSELQASPSIQAGMTPDQEKATRAKGIQLINEVGQKLRLHQTTIATAAMFFHRFYMRMSLVSHHHYVCPLTTCTSIIDLLVADSGVFFRILRQRVYS
jgi:protein BUR2